MVRGIGSVVAGYVTMVVVVMVGTFMLVATLVPGGVATMKKMRDDPTAMTPTPAYLASNLVLSLLAAIAGGWVTMLIAGAPFERKLMALAALVLVMGVVSARMQSSRAQPGWYNVVIPVVGVLGVLLSGVLFGGRITS